MIRERLKDLLSKVLDSSLKVEGSFKEVPWLDGWVETGMQELFSDGKFRPVGAGILVKDIGDPEKITGAGIVLLGSRKQEELQRAIVVGVSKNGIPLKNKEGKVYSYRLPIVKEGDVVLYESFRGVEVRQGLEIYVLVQEGDIVGTMEGESE